MANLPDGVYISSWDTAVNQPFTSRIGGGPVQHAQYSPWQVQALMAGGNMPPSMRDVKYKNPGRYETPKAYEKGTYVAPTYDEQRVQDLTQTSAAGAMRGLRSAMQRVSGGSFANPNVKRMTLRDALAGYGQGVQSAMSGAADTARNLYNTEYSGKTNEAMQNFQAGESAKQANYGTEQSRAQMEYQGRLAMSQAQYQAEQNRAMQEYQTMWNNYNAAQDRMLRQSSSGGGGGTTRFIPNDYEEDMRNRGFR
jgi:hypothetical protein